MNNFHICHQENSYDGDRLTAFPELISILQDTIETSTKVFASRCVHTQILSLDFHCFVFPATEDAV